MASYENQTNGAGPPPQITLYTNHRCPYAHRAHITLKELDLPFEEVIIDLETPRPQWYLDINPRGLVPTIKYTNGSLTDEIITESAIVSQFLADARPSHLLPASLSSPSAPLVRARINFFIDTWNCKISSHMFQVLKAEDQGEKEELTSKWVEAVRREVEPLLKDAGPFFGGSGRMTLAEAITAPFVIRAYTMSRDGSEIPKSLVEQLDALPNFSKWAKAVMAQESVTYVFDEKATVEGTKKMVMKLRGQK